MPVPPPPLRADGVDPDPVVQFRRWYDEAAAVVAAPEAVALATADASGRPSVRMVLCKEFGDDGFVFYTNDGSRKGSDLAANPRAALAFYWEPLGRQVRVEGPAAPVDGPAADRYFATRTRGSRLGARASRQSRPVADRATLERAVAEEAARWPDDVPRPPWWYGWRVGVDTLELWQQRPDRLHDRLRYRREGGGWVIERLQP